MRFERWVGAVTDGRVTLRLVESVQRSNLPSASPRLIAHDGERWAQVAGACPTKRASVFLAGGQLYLAWAEDQQVVWGPVPGP